MAKAKKKTTTDPVFKAIADYTAQAQHTEKTLTQATNDRESIKKTARRIAATALETRVIQDAGGYVMPDDQFYNRTYETYLKSLMNSVDGKIIEFCEETAALHLEKAAWTLI